VYCQAFGASAEDIAYFGGLGRRLATERDIPFIALCHEPPTTRKAFMRMARTGSGHHHIIGCDPEIAIVGYYGNSRDGGDYPWHISDGNTLELSPGVTHANRNAPAHIVLDLVHKDAVRFSWENIDRIKFEFKQ